MVMEEHTSPSSSSNQGQPMEQTSASGSEGEHVVQPSPKSVAESCDHAREEHTSASDNEAATQQQCAISASHAEARQEVTTSSSEMAPLVSEEDELVSQMPPKKRRRYTCHKRKGHAHVTVSVQGIFTSKPVHICRKAAEFLIGVGPMRVQRVLYGEVDRRTEGARLPLSC